MIEVRFLSHGRKAQVAPNPDFPSGVDLDLTHGATRHCEAKLPYPAECLSIWVLHCLDCGFTAAITTAGRPGDPRSVKLACKANA